MIITLHQRKRRYLKRSKMQIYPGKGCLFCVSRNLDIGSIGFIVCRKWHFGGRERIPKVPFFCNKKPKGTAPPPP